MKFFSISDRIDDLVWRSTSTKEKILNSAKLVGAVVANPVIAVGKAMADVAPDVKERIEEEKKRRKR
jgi:hypothetical protein